MVEVPKDYDPDELFKIDVDDPEAGLKKLLGAEDEAETAEEEDS